MQMTQKKEHLICSVFLLEVNRALLIALCEAEIETEKDIEASPFDL